MLSDGGKCLFSAGKNFMCIGLMAHIPDNFILRIRKDSVERYCQLYNSQIGRQVTAILRNCTGDLSTYFAAKLIQFCYC